MSEQSQQGLHEQLQARILEAEQQLQASEHAIAGHFDEMARITQVLDQEQLQKAELEQKLTVLRQQLVHAQAQQSESNTDDQDLILQQHSRLLLESEMFDSDWYLHMYSDIKESSMFAKAPHVHYLRFGAFEGRNPCPEFDSFYYLNQYPDVADSGINPLVHYLLFGRAEGRQAHPSFKV